MPRNLERKKTHKHKHICGIVPGMGGWQKFVYVFFSGHSLWGRKTHKQNPPPKSRDNPVKILFMHFFSLCVFCRSPPEIGKFRTGAGRRGWRVKFPISSANCSYELPHEGEEEEENEGKLRKAKKNEG